MLYGDLNFRLRKVGVSLGESGGLDWGKSQFTHLFLQEKSKDENFVK